MRKLISVVMPAYNESENVDELARRLTAVFDGLKDRYEFEVIVVENGSVDDTFEKLLAVRRKDPRFKILRLTMNFGGERAITAALAQASGDAAIIMMSDLQDPPELIPEFIARWEEGYKNVYGVVRKRNDESWLRGVGTAGFYWLMHRASKRAVPTYASEFRLVDRTLYEAFNALPKRYRMLRLAWAWLNFPSIGVEHERQARTGGRSTFRFVSHFFSGMRTVLSWSTQPLKYVPYFGLFVAFLSFVALAGSVARAFIWGVPFNGFETLLGINLLLFGLVFLFLGLISEYVGIVIEQVRVGPMYVVRDRYGLQDRRVDSEDNIFVDELLKEVQPRE